MTYDRGMTSEECESHLKNLVDIHGAKCLFPVWLESNGHEKLAQRYRRFSDFSYENLSKDWNVHEDYLLEKCIILKGKADAMNARFKDRPKKEPYVWKGAYPRGMTKEDCENHLSHLYEKHGIKSLFCKWLCENGHQELYIRYNGFRECSLTEFAQRNNFTNERDEFEKHLNGKRYDIVSGKRTKWTEETLKLEIEKVVKEYGFLPPAGFLTAENNFQGLAGAIQKFGGHKAIKEKYNIGDRLRLYDKLGQIWNSFPEASTANYLLSKGIKPIKGQRYPAEYAEMSGMNHGVYDMHFVATAGHLENQLLNIEIFGDNPGGRGAEEYALVRSFKERFNQNDKCFISIEHLECYKIQKLEDILGKHIAIANSLINDDAVVTDIFDPTMWSLADEVLVRLKKVCEKMPDGLLPSSCWFLREKSHKNRTIEEWESDTWTGLMDNVSNCGGILKFRAALGQGTDHLNQYQLTKAETVEELRKFHAKWKQTPKAFQHRDKATLSGEEKEGWEKALELTSCMNRHFDSVNEACEAASIPMNRYRLFDSKEAVEKGLIDFYWKHNGRSPRSIEKQLAKNKSKTDEEKRLQNDSYNLQRNARKFFDSYGEAWKLTTEKCVAIEENEQEIELP